MARFPRVVVPGVPHHVTQRGNARQMILSDDGDRIAYLELLQRYCELYHLPLLGYCLMSNHVHLIAVPPSAEALSQTLKHTHGRYASYWTSSGHVWQGRFYSCPLDDSHVWAAPRYVELNPIRAGMAAAAEQWPWSSAAIHCQPGRPDRLLDIERWRQRWTEAEWKQYMAAYVSTSDIAELRQNTHTGRPLGRPEFIAQIEQSTSRLLAPRKGGRPKNPSTNPLQSGLSFVA